MKNIHIIPTDKPSRLSIKDNILILHRLQWRKGTQNIYITNDEEIKEGNWCFEVHNGDSKANSPKFIDEKGNTWWLRKANANDIAGCPTTKKIILTTDQDLIKDGVQAIDNEFLEWFVKNPSCDNVEVERDSREVGGHNGGVQIEYGYYEIIIPKEEPKQETLEEVAEKSFKYIDYKNTFIAGAKWQQENSYSEQDMIDFAYKYIDERKDQGARAMTPELLIKQFKKK